ncbi:DNA recombination protein RmuC [Nakamurella antarctica]|uniref:DNA recombination protein RmuC n=1 Tax=Nakamurella antarctica TaxID=1902245 RepID=A0A3G8ZUK3_9ACTN|nr:DNA recombination protein RmuC [Nakamurella antarctica]AZI57401.1 DNA recombination protein RmuC [Nakamurella antarctica]
MDLSTAVIALLLLGVGLACGFYLGRLSGQAAGRTEAERTDAVTVGALLAPAADALVRVESQIRDIERDRVGAYAALREQIGALHRTSADLTHQTKTLAGALRTPQVRGRWGEIQLERIVELAGMAEHCDFDTQMTTGVAHADGTFTRSRPDLVVHLSGDRHIPVDAKVPFTAWLEAMDRGEGPEAAALLTAHSRAVRAHVDALAAKSYWQLFQPAPEFVVMFIPGEPLLDAALVRDPGLLDYAFSRNVVIATPTTLITLLRTVAFSWRQEKLGASAAQIHTLGADLYKRLSTMGEHLDKLGVSLGKAVQSYNSTVSSLESRVLVTARKFADLGVAPVEIPLLSQVEIAPRQPQAVELVNEPPRAI